MNQTSTTNIPKLGFCGSTIHDGKTPHPRNLLCQQWHKQVVVAPKEWEVARKRVQEFHPSAYAAFLSVGDKGWIIRVFERREKSLAGIPFWPLTEDRRETEAEAWMDADALLAKEKGTNAN